MFLYLLDGRIEVGLDSSFLDAVFNIGRASLLVAGLATGHHEYLRLATQDRLHQPYREPLFPAMKVIFVCNANVGRSQVTRPLTGS